jgi:hypothetical protein
MVATAVSLVLAATALVANPVRDSGSEPAPTDVQWLYWSPLCVQEVITELGGGEYRYLYFFENVDTNHIWHFGVYTPFAPLWPTATWDTRPTWSAGTVEIWDVLPPYDARTVDPAILQLANTWAPEYGADDPIDPGEIVSGFSFVAPVFDASPKLYFYETTESGYAGKTGFVAAIGTTCTSPVSVESASWGGVKALYR